MRTTPDIVVVDDFLPDPVMHRATALGQRYVASEYHKGHRSEGQFLTVELKLAFEGLLCRKIVRWEEHGMNGRFQISLAGEQLVYHSDIQTHAAALYLTPDAPVSAGTAFWQSLATSARRQPLDLATAAKTYDGKLLDPTAWELVDRVGNVFNRLVLWDGKLIHSAACYFGDNLDNGRLTQLFFFDSE